MWRRQQATFGSRVVGPHFGSLCRAWAAGAGQEAFGDLPAEVSAGAVTDPGGRRQIEVDVAVLGPGLPGEALTSQAAADQRILLAGLDRLYG